MANQIPYYASVTGQSPAPPVASNPLISWTVSETEPNPANTGDGMFGMTVAIGDDGVKILAGPGDSTQAVDTGGLPFDGAAVAYTVSGTQLFNRDLFSHTDASNQPDFFGGDPNNFTDTKQIAVFENGDRIAVGAYFYPIGGTSSGAVYIMDLSGTYSQTQRIDLGGTGDNEEYGFSIAVSGDGLAGSVMVVGAPQDTSGEGRVYVYENQVGVWTLVQTLAGGFGANDQQFGTNVVLSRDGSTLAVGENWESGSMSGDPFWEFFYNTYSWNGSTFDLIERFSPNPAGDIWNGGYMQADLSDDGTILGMSIGDNNAWVATLGGGTWATTDLTSLMPGLNRYVGFGMNGAGDLIFVGSNSETGGNGASGVVHVLKNDGGWILQDTVDNPDATDTGYSEWGRAIESNIYGDRVAVGNGYGDGGFGGGGELAILFGKETPAVPLVISFSDPFYDLDFFIGPDPSGIVGVVIENNGNITMLENGFPVSTVGTWFTGDHPPNLNAYEIIYDQVSAEVPNQGFSPINTWLAMGGGGEAGHWEWEYFPGGPPDNCEAVLRIRNASTLVEITTADLFLRVTN